MGGDHSARIESLVRCRELQHGGDPCGRAGGVRGHQGQRAGRGQSLADCSEERLGQISSFGRCLLPEEVLRLLPGVGRGGGRWSGSFTCLPLPP